MTRSYRMCFRALLPATLACAGCGHSPSVNVLGSYFPGWIACMVAGGLLAVGVRLLLRKLDVEHALPWLPLFYFCVAAIFASAFWLVTFS